MDKLRERFEKWATGKHCWNKGIFALHSIDDYYLNHDVQEEWESWLDGYTAGAEDMRERAALTCESEHVGESVFDECENEGDASYNTALQHACASIKAPPELVEQQRQRIAELEKRPQLKTRCEPTPEIQEDTLDRMLVGVATEGDQLAARTFILAVLRSLSP